MIAVVFDPEGTLDDQFHNGRSLLLGRFHYNTNRLQSMSLASTDCKNACAKSDDRFLLPFFWHDISIVLIEAQSHEDSKPDNEQRRF